MCAERETPNKDQDKNYSVNAESPEKIRGFL